jgi:hypothetical protein
MGGPAKRTSPVSIAEQVAIVRLTEEKPDIAFLPHPDADR